MATAEAKAYWSQCCWTLLGARRPEGISRTGSILHHNSCCPHHPPLAFIIMYHCHPSTVLRAALRSTTHTYKHGVVHLHVCVYEHLYICLQCTYIKAFTHVYIYDGQIKGWKLRGEWWRPVGSLIGAAHGVGEGHTPCHLGVRPHRCLCPLQSCCQCFSAFAMKAAGRHLVAMHDPCAYEQHR